MGHVTLVVINETTILVPYLWVKSLQLIWKSAHKAWSSNELHILGCWVGTVEDIDARSRYLRQG